MVKVLARKAKQNSALTSASPPKPVPLAGLVICCGRRFLSSHDSLPPCWAACLAISSLLLSSFTSSTSPPLPPPQPSPPARRTIYRHRASRFTRSHACYEARRPIESFKTIKNEHDPASGGPLKNGCSLMTLRYDLKL